MHEGESKFGRPVVAFDSVTWGKEGRKNELLKRLRLLTHLMNEITVTLASTTSALTAMQQHILTKIDSPVAFSALQALLLSTV